jgi:chaperonin cofactor prefoldin
MSKGEPMSNDELSGQELELELTRRLSNLQNELGRLATGKRRIERRYAEVEAEIDATFNWILGRTNEQ